MEIKLTLNGERIVQDIEPDLLLIDFVRKNGCYSVKRGCDTSNCGLCTVLLMINQCFHAVFLQCVQMVQK